MHPVYRKFMKFSMAPAATLLILIILGKIYDVRRQEVVELSPTKGEMWVLVVFLEEDVLSHPIRLEEIQDLSGRNGVEADLQEWDKCMARYHAGYKWRKAVLLRRSDDEEKLRREYERIMEAVTKENESRKKSKISHIAKGVVGGAVIGGLAVVAAPLALAAAGFSTGGIVAGSLAAKLMSMAAIANGGGVAAASAGGLIAAAQSAGVLGISAGTSLGIGVGAGTAGGLVVSKITKKS